jgi:hypothetical protein
VIFGDDDKKTNMHYGRNTNRLSSSTLRITRRGPSEPNFTIVDIPGLVRGEFITKDWVNITDFVKETILIPSTEPQDTSWRSI